MFFFSDANVATPCGIRTLTPGRLPNRSISTVSHSNRGRANPIGSHHDRVRKAIRFDWINSPVKRQKAHPSSDLVSGPSFRTPQGGRLPRQLFSDPGRGAIPPGLPLRTPPCGDLNRVLWRQLLDDARRS